MNPSRPLTALACLLLPLGACAPPEKPAPPPPPAATAPQAVAGPSLYELEMKLVDQDARERTFDTFRGQPTLLEMFYATCPTACPVLLKSIRDLEASLRPADLARIRVLLVSLDPGRDVPSVLKEAAERHGADPARWALCRAEDEDVRTLAAVLGVRYRAEMDGTIDHSSAVALLAPDGTIVATVEGPGQPLDPLRLALEAMEAP